MTAQGKVRGGCLCGALEFEVELPTRWSAHCHCTLCQRAHGAALVTWVGVDAARFALIRAETLSWYRSSANAERGFCSRCGSTLLFRSERWADEMHVVRAAFRGPLDREPAAHVFYDSHVDWLTVDDGLRRIGDPFANGAG